jgi:predicted regulator of Ras-like GTPase activity (Roadblock/LC7/MglB family)
VRNLFQDEMANQLEETLKRIQSSDGVEGFIVLNNDGLQKSFRQKLVVFKSIYIAIYQIRLIFRCPH